MTAMDNPPPLCVDLDGTLTPVDTLHESLLSLVRRAPVFLLSLPALLAKGKARFKQEVAARAQVDVAHLPLRAELIDWLKNERAHGRRLILVTASDRRMAEAVSAHLALFDEVIASDGADNLAGEHKRAALVRRFGEKGYDYIGNESADLAVWKSARHAIVVGPPALVDGASRLAEVERSFAVAPSPLRLWIKAARLHQWVKNVLIFLPALLAHSILEPTVLIAALLAFVAYGLCASSVYVINDLLDLDSDRRHPRKRKRPFASGALSARAGLVFAAALLALAVVIAVSVGARFCVVLAGYYVLTWAYSVRLKRAAIVDVMTLAGLYTMRIIAGAAATGIPPSFWLLALSVFGFMSLGVVKRYTELYDADKAGTGGGHGRGYSAVDLPLLLSLGTATGFCSVVVMALYINSPDSQVLYHHTRTMWLICPLMLYWISRVWLLTARGQMHDDPVVFAVRDRISLATFALIGIIVLIAI
jgi:4-hydroxybenzoate polyprenyltransferase/phosphoserine phosphatase